MHPATLPHPALVLPPPEGFLGRSAGRILWMGFSIHKPKRFVFCCGVRFSKFQQFLFSPKPIGNEGNISPNQIGKGKSSLTHMKPAGGRRYCYFPGGYTNQRAGVKPSQKWIAWTISFWRWWVLQLYPLEVEFDFLLNALDPQRRRPLFWRKGFFHQHFQVDPTLRRLHGRLAWLSGI